MTTPYVDPQTVHNPAPGTSPPASWGDTVRDGLEFLARPPGCVVQRASAQATGASGVVTPVSFTDADLRDTDNYHSTTTNPTRITIPAGLGGWYAITAEVTIYQNSTGARVVTVRRNGTTLEPAVATLADSNGYFQGIWSSELLLNAGDYVELMVRQDSGITLNMTARMSVRLVAVS